MWASSSMFIPNINELKSVLSCVDLEFILNFYPPQKIKTGMWSQREVTVTWHNSFLVYLAEMNLYLCPSRWSPHPANQKKTTIPDAQRWTEMCRTWTGFLRRPWSRYPTGNSLLKWAFKKSSPWHVVPTFNWVKKKSQFYFIQNSFFFIFHFRLCTHPRRVCCCCLQPFASDFAQYLLILRVIMEERRKPRSGRSVSRQDERQASGSGWWRNLAAEGWALKGHAWKKPNECQD